MALTAAERRALARSIPASQIMAAKRHGMQQGKGFMDIVKKAAHFLGPIAKAIGPVLLKELLKKAGLQPEGSGLKLSGSGRKRRKKK